VLKTFQGFNPEYGWCAFENFRNARQHVLTVHVRHAFTGRLVKPRKGFLEVEANLPGSFRSPQILTTPIDLSKGFSELVFDGDYEMVWFKTMGLPDEFSCDIRLESN